MHPLSMLKESRRRTITYGCLILLLSYVAHASRSLISSGQSLLANLHGSDCLASEVHLSLSEDNRDVRVAWRTQASGCPSTVSYGISSSAGLEAPMLRSEGSSYTITEKLMCEAPAKERRFTVNMHVAVMSDLTPQTEYWYSLDGGDRTFTFRSPRRVGADEPFSFIAFGDMGDARTKGRKCGAAAATVDAITREVNMHPADFILHMGDLSYADGKYKVWDSFMDQIEPLASRMPYMVGIGNHEAGPCKGGSGSDPSGEPPYEPDWGNFGPESGGECGAMIAHRFIMPGGQSEQRGGAFAAAAAAAEEGARRRRTLIAQTATAMTSHILADEYGVNGATAVNGGVQADSAQAVQADSAQALPTTDAAAAAAGAAAGLRERNAGEQNPPFWYSFDYGTVHFTVLSSEHDLTEGSTQQRWLEADLAGVDRCRTPWLVVGLHRPMYVVYPHKDNRIVGAHILAAIEDLLLRHDVDVVISGHVHAYYRSCSAADYKCVDDPAKGIVHLVIGSAGHALSSVEDDQKDWCDVVINDHGFGRFDVDGDVLRVSFIRSQDGVVADTLTLRSKVAQGKACARMTA